MARDRGDAPPAWPPLLLVNAEHDWTLDTHTDEVMPLLAACGLSDVARVTLRGTDHIGYVLGMARRGWAGQEVAVPAVAGWLAARLAA